MQLGTEISEGYHTFSELYDHRIMLFLALMKAASDAGLECGWSRRHDDGELCFGGGWVIGWINCPFPTTRGSRFILATAHWHWRWWVRSPGGANGQCAAGPPSGSGRPSFSGG